MFNDILVLRRNSEHRISITIETISNSPVEVIANGCFLPDNVCIGVAPALTSSVMNLWSGGYLPR